MRVTVALLDRQGINVVERVLEVLKAIGAEGISNFGLISPNKSYLNDSLDFLYRQCLKSPVAVGYASSQPRSSNGYDFLQLEDATLVFEGSVYSPVSKTAIIQQLSKEPHHCEAILQTLVRNADGDYSFQMLKKDWIAAGRDPIGVQPLYYGENKNILAIATNRKALWKLGIENPSSFPPGNLSFIKSNGFQFKPIQTLNYSKPITVTINEAAQKLQSLLEQSVRNRTSNVNRIAVAFSGGLDSSIVAKIASQQGSHVSLIHVSMENQPETEEAIEASEALNLPLQVCLFKDSDVEKNLPKVIELIEEADPIKASVGLPFFWTAEKAAEEGLRVLLAGQGADELFGGYQRYVNEYCKEGAEKILRTMFNDVVKIHESNLERDMKITSYHNIELRLPFGSFELAKFALTLPIECKIEKKQDTLRKLVLRKVAQNLGMPAALIDKPKKAVQYSTGVNDAIKRISKKQKKTVNEYIVELFQRSKA